MHARAVGPVLLACGALAACGKRGDPAPAPAPAPSAGHAPGAAPAASAPPAACAGETRARDVTFAAPDGLVVHATSVSPCGGAPRPVVVLAHKMCSSRAEWSAPSHDWVGALTARGVATLAIDLRGHGASKAFPGGATHDLCAEASSAAARPLFAGMVGDVKGAVAFARGEMHAPRVALVGASIGANAAIVAFADDPSIAAAIALSPGLDYHGVATEPSIARAAGRALIVEAARDDAPSLAAATRFAELSPAIEEKTWPSGGHGNAMLDAHPEELPRLVARLEAALTSR